jgi:hypothetical protein
MRMMTGAWANEHAGVGRRDDRGRDDRRLRRSDVDAWLRANTIGALAS